MIAIIIIFITIINYLCVLKFTQIYGQIYKYLIFKMQNT